MTKIIPKEQTFQPFNDLSATDDSLTVDTCKIVPFYIDDLDKIQNKYDAATEAAQRAQRRLNNRLDQKVLSNYSSANAYISAQDLGGSGTGSTAITQANIYNLFAVGARKLEHANLTGLEKKAVIGPRLLEVLKLGIANRETSFGDSVGANGLVGSRFGFDVVVSNNIPFTAVLPILVNTPVDAGTITIDDVVFTWELTKTVLLLVKFSWEQVLTTAGDNLVLLSTAQPLVLHQLIMMFPLETERNLRDHGISSN